MAGVGTVTEFQDPRRVVTVTVASSGTISTVADLVGCRLVGVRLSTAFTGTGLHFLVAATTGTTGALRLMKNSTGGSVKLTVAANIQAHVGDPALWWGVRRLALLTGATTSGSKQAAARSIDLVATARG